MNRKLSSFFLLLLVAAIGFAQAPFTKITTTPLDDDGLTNLGAIGIDLNGDTLVDFYAVGVNSNNSQYLNNGSGSFAASTFNDGVTGISATAADYDNDGDNDIYVASYSGDNDALLQNDGNGNFTAISNVMTTPTLSNHCAAWVDYDNDGLLDLFVSNFSGNNLLYHNTGSGNFAAVTTGPLVNTSGVYVGGAWADYDNDGDQDVFIADFGAGDNQLFRNDGAGTFTAIAAGDMLTDGGDTHSGSWGDYDNDGWLDLFVTNSNSNGNFLYHNNGDGTFTRNTNTVVDNDNVSSTGSGWADYDNDGDLDLFVTNTSYQSPATSNFLFRNDGGTFTKITTGDLVTGTVNSRGISWADYDMDGFLDLYIVNEDGSDDLLFNNDGNNNHWLSIHLTGIQSNKSAIGARVRVKALINGTPVWQLRDVQSQTGYASQNSLEVEFGLGTALGADSIVVEWPSGTVCVYTEVNADQFLYYDESCGVSSTNDITAEAQLLLFPNPTANTVTLQSSLQGKVNITVFDLLGQQMFEQEVNAARATLNVAALAAGSYILHLQTADGSVAKARFVVAK